MVHTHELPRLLAVGNDGVREGLVTAKGQCAVQVDRIAVVRCPRTRSAGTQNESGKKKFSEHGGDVSLYRCVVGNVSTRVQHA